MNPDVVAGMSTSIAVMLFIFSMPFIWIEFYRDAKKKALVITLSLFLGVVPLVWLVSPWIGLGIYNIHRTNTGLVNDQMRQEKVLEPEEKTRPSKVDTKEN